MNWRVDMKETEIHIHLDGQQDGPVHVFVHGPDDEVTAVAADDDGSSTDSDHDLESMLARFEAFDATTSVRELFHQLSAQGWTALTPKPRGGRTKSEAAYLRMVFVGAETKVRIYLNTTALIASGQSEQAIVKEMPGAQERSRDVYVYHSGSNGDLANALAAAEALRNYADGQTVGS